MASGDRAKACPQGGSGKVRFAKTEEEPSHLFVLRRFRKCVDCGAVFLPMSWRAHAVFLIISGILLPAMLIHHFIIRGPGAVDIVLGGLALLWPLKILGRAVGVWRGRAV